MVATNNITGDKIQTRVSTTYADKFDGIFNKDKEDKTCNDTTTQADTITSTTKPDGSD